MPETVPAAAGTLHAIAPQSISQPIVTLLARRAPVLINRLIAECRTWASILVFVEAVVVSSRAWIFSSVRVTTSGNFVILAGVAPDRSHATAISSESDTAPAPRREMLPLRR